MLVAYECRLAGASVTLIEKNWVGQESSWAGGGILLPIYPWRQAEAITQLVIQSHKIYPELIAQLQAKSGIDPEFIQSGMLICQNPDFNDAIVWCQQNGIAYESPSEELLGSVCAEMQQPLWLPEIRQARNPRLLKAVHATLKVMGVKIIEQCEVQAFEITNSRLQSVLTSQGRLPVDELVLAAGAWAGEFWQQYFNLGSPCEVQVAPVKGEMLLYAAKPEALNTMVLDHGRYLIPRADGHILVGSTVEYAGFDKSLNSQTHSELSQFATRILPDLASFPVVKHWAGLRPGTDLGIPYIARHPEISNLSVNAGHFRNGLTMAPAAAQLTLDLILKRKTAIALQPYQLESVH